MNRDRAWRAALAATAVAMSCADSSRYAVVEVEDPERLAQAATTLHFGPSLESLGSTDRHGRPFPLTFGLESKRDEVRPLWVEARSATGAVLARGRPAPNGTVGFRRGSTATVRVVLGRACAVHTDCDRDDTCVPTGTCEDFVCRYPPKPCDDGNDNPNDGCDVCRPTRWTSSVLVGNGEGRGVATEVALSFPYGLAVDRRGNVFVADSGHHRVLRVDAGTRLVTTVAGTGEPGPSDDDVQATSARLNQPRGVAVDGSGNLFVADMFNRSVRRICGDGLGCTVGEMTTVAGGGGEEIVSGTWSPATRVQLWIPRDVAVDDAGNVYIADEGLHRVLRVCGDGLGCTAGELVSIAGNGVAGFAGDGGPAQSAQLDQPRAVAVDRAANVYIADVNAHRVRRICGAGPACTRGNIDTVAGTGVYATGGDGGLATNTPLRLPSALATTPEGDLLIAEAGGDRVRRVCLSARACEPGVISTLAGDAGLGYSGDAGPATAASLNGPSGLAVDRYGNLLIADTNNHRVRRVCADGVDCTATHITTLVGTGTPSPSCTGATATSAPLQWPSAAAVGASGELFVTDTQSMRVLRFCAGGAGCGNAEVSVFAGGGSADPASGGVAAIDAQLREPRGLATDAGGNLYIADSPGARVYRVCTNGAGCAVDSIATIAGTGVGGFSGDGGPATEAQLLNPQSVAVDGRGNIFIADQGNRRVRRVCGDALACVVGSMDTVAGNGALGAAGDGGPATSAQLNHVASVAVDTAGNLFIADGGSHRVRRVCFDSGSCTVGQISTYAGNGTQGFSGDAGPALAASLSAPSAVAADRFGNLFIVDKNNRRLRKVCGDGVGCTQGYIETVAGSGATASSGDGGPALGAAFELPIGLAVDAAGDAFVVDSYGLMVRRVCLRGGGGCVVGQIHTVAGLVDPRGDGALETSRLRAPHALLQIENGESSGLLITDGVSGRVRWLDPAAGLLTTRVGYPGGFVEESAVARYSRLLLDARGAALDPSTQTLFVSEFQGHTIRAVSLSTSPWTISTFAGVLPRSACCAADGNAACTSAELNYPRCADASPGYREGSGASALFANPSDLVFDAERRLLFVADAGNHVIRSIAVDSGETAIVAGTPRARGDFGDGVAATEALLDSPQALALAPDGSLYIADTGNNRVRRVDPSGFLDTVLGDGASASSGEGGPARYFPVDRPQGLALDIHGNLFASSSRSVRVVTAGTDGVATGDDDVITIYGRAPRLELPESVTACLSGIQVLDGASGEPASRLRVLDACAGYVLQLDRER